MTSNQPYRPASPVVAYYERLFATLTAARAATGDPTVLAFENYMRWKGVPADGVKLQTPPEPLSAHFSIMEYPAAHRYVAYCTLGASRTAIPGSEIHFGETNGVRYEYILHAFPRYAAEAANLLITVAEYPYTQQIEVGPGFVLPVGEPVVEGSPMEYLYFTYPYVDDPSIYEQQPWGQIERDGVLIQTLWVFPIYKSEFEFIRKNGVEAFEDVCYAKHAQHYDADDFMREPYV